MKQRMVAAALVGALGSASLLAAKPASAATPHDLRREDEYDVPYPAGEPGEGPISIECAILGRSTLRADGTAQVSAAIAAGDERCREEVTIEGTVSYVSTSGQTLRFRFFGGSGYAGANLENVERDLVFSYAARHNYYGEYSGHYKLPK